MTWSDLGTGREALSKLAALDHSDKHDVRGVTIVGMGALTGEDGAEVLATVRGMAEAAQSRLLILAYRRRPRGCHRCRRDLRGRDRGGAVVAR